MPRPGILCVLPSCALWFVCPGGVARDVAAAVGWWTWAAAAWAVWAAAWAWAAGSSVGDRSKPYQASAGSQGGAVGQPYARKELGRGLKTQASRVPPGGP